MGQGVILPSEGMEDDELYYVDFDGDCLEYVLHFFYKARRMWAARHIVYGQY